MTQKLNLFVISSPLQLLTVTNIQLQFKKNKGETSVLFVEGQRYNKTGSLHCWDDIIVGEYVRPRRDDIVKNLKINFTAIEKIIKTYQPTEVELFISDLYWVSSNAIYALLLQRFKNHFKCSIFDEGAALYTKENLLLRDRIRSIIKWAYLKCKGIPYQPLYEHSFENHNPRIDHIYCYHPDLFQHSERKKKTLELDPSLLNDFLHQLTHLEKPKTIRKGTLLFISQPYLLHINRDDFKQVIADMINYFKAQGVNEFYIKPHHLDEPDWLTMLSNKYHFLPFHDDPELAIEAYAQYLDYEYIVSFSSSALMNLKKFGYQGTVVSYGLNEFDKHKGTRRINKNVKRIFQQKGVMLIG